MLKIKNIFWFIVLYIFCYDVERRIRISSTALDYLKLHAAPAVETLENSAELQAALKKITNPALLLLNQHALDVTLNFLCNVGNFKDIQNRLILIAFDEISSNTLRANFPTVAVVHVDIPAFYNRFHQSEGAYQLFQAFRAKLSSYLAARVESFWMIQADTIWRASLFDVIDPQLLDEHDLLFDSEGESGLLADMTAGGYYYAKGGRLTAEFFDKIYYYVMNYYLTDNNVMTKIRIEYSGSLKCGHIPYTLIVNWRWQPPIEITSSTPLPALIQFDGGDSADSKLATMHRLGVAFLDFDVLKTSTDANPQKRRAVCISKDFDEHGYLAEKRFLTSKSRGKVNVVLQVAHGCAEIVWNYVPGLRNFLLRWIFPFFAYYLVI